MECSYTTEDKDQQFCPYDGCELVESNEITTNFEEPIKK
jgi:hypothetical protein